MRIAIYSRKSKFTGKGESIDNQVQLCKDHANRMYDNIDRFYIYEDEGFSGGNTNRPKFLEMMEDAKGKKFDKLICYRLDRISRDVADFSFTIEKLNDNNIDFVSIKEQFDTSTPIGRAMMYIASVFSQLERETIAERIKDNMLQLATTGRWLGGKPPLGFESEKVIYLDEEFKERTLTILEPNQEEMEMVTYIYDEYIYRGSIHQVRKHLMKDNHKTSNDAYFSSRVISDILRNPAYVKVDKEVIEYLENKNITVHGKELLDGEKGILIYNKKNRKGIKNDYDKWIAAIAKHKGIMESSKWLRVQYQLDKNSMILPRKGTSDQGLLSGIIKCGQCGSGMNILYGRKRKDGTSLHYYTCSLKGMSASAKCDNTNLSGMDVEYTVINKILELAKDKDILLEELEALNKGNKKESNSNTLVDLTNKQDKLKNEINNLVDELSKNAAVSKYIIPQIESKDKKLQKIKEQIENLRDTVNEDKTKKDNLDLVVNNIIDFGKLIDTLDNEQKKFFIQTIVEKVVWDGEIISIHLFTNDVSQFHSTSSSTSDETGIILYNNLMIYPRYANYPEKTIGDRIRKKRFERGYTAKELAKKSKCSVNSIYGYESDNGQPSKALLKRISKALNVSISYFKK